MLPLFTFILAHHAYYGLAEHYDYRLTDSFEHSFEHSLNSLLTNYYTESPQIGSDDPPVETPIKTLYPLA